MQRALCFMLCYAMQYGLYTLHCTLYIAHTNWCTAHIFIVQRVLCAAVWTLFTAQRKTRRIAQSADPHCTLCTVHCEQWHSTHRTHLHPPPQHWALNSLNPFVHFFCTGYHMYTVFLTLYTVHCIPTLLLHLG